MTNLIKSKFMTQQLKKTKRITLSLSEIRFGIRNSILTGRDVLICKGELATYASLEYIEKIINLALRQQKTLNPTLTFTIKIS